MYVSRREELFTPFTGIFPVGNKPTAETTFEVMTLFVAPVSHTAWKALGFCITFATVGIPTRICVMS